MATAAVVNRPTNPLLRDSDVENKMHLYGIYEAFSNGKLPSNRQIDTALTSLIEHERLKHPNEKLSAEGRLILEDFREAVDEAKRLLLTKNHDQALQEFIYNTTQLGVQGGPQTAAPNAPVSKEVFDSDRQQGLEGLRTLGELLITNGQFRKLLSDASILFRDIAGDAAAKTAGRINPSEEEMKQMDRSAPDNEWHEAPHFSKATFKNQVRSQFHQNKPVTRKDVQEVAGNVTQATKPGKTENDAQRGLETGVEGIRQRVSENVPEEHKKQAHEYRDRTKHYLQEKMPQERQDQTIHRLKQMIVEIQSHRDYQKAIDTLLRLAENYSGHGRTLATEGSGTVKSAHKDSHLRSAEENLKTLIERFANNTSADDLMESINDIYRAADRDPELKTWFRALNTYIRKCLKEEGYIMQDESTQEYNALYNHGNYLLRERYRDHTDRVIDELKFLSEQFTNDSENRNFGNKMQKLFNDLGNDENGKPVYKKHLMKDVTDVIVPELLESVRYIPLPRIEYSDHMIEAVVENLVVESDNLMPNVLEIASDSYFRWGRKSIASKKRQHVMINASQIQCDLRDISYYIKRKHGFPTITDMGIADVFLGGDGLSFKLHLSTVDEKDKANFFKVEKVDVHISNMKIKLKKSQHKLLFGIFKPLLLQVMKPALSRLLEQQIKTTFRQLDALAHRIYLEEKKIEENLKENPDTEQAKNFYYRYYQAAQKELVRRREEAVSKSKEKKVNLAITKEDSIFRNIVLPGGISTRATELSEQARAGDRWENELFNLGSKQPTTRISNPPPVTRKSPFASKRTLKEREARESGSIGRESRDSGYLGEGYSLSKDGSAIAGGNMGGMGGVDEEYGSGSGFAERIQEEGVGGKQAEVLGSYTLNKSVGEKLSMPATEAGRA
ncbi:hypothetical protein RUND412_005943 [Rhizina undulata]